jgi:hypothetical protein
MMILMLLAVTAPYRMPPSPPAPATSGAALERELSSIGQRLRTQCFSEKGIGIVVQNIRQQRAIASPLVPAIRATNKEVADAAYTKPFDVARMVQALRARARVQAEANLRSPEGSIEILQQLPAPDKMRYARYILGTEPVYPQSGC